MLTEDKFALIGSDIFRFKRSTDVSFFIFDASPSIWKASFQKRLECALVISEKAFRMEGETSKIKILASAERLNLNNLNASG